MRTFGPKSDKWLKYTVAGLPVTIRTTQILSRSVKQLQLSRVLGIGTAGTLLAVDLVNVPRGRSAACTSRGKEDPDLMTDSTQSRSMAVPLTGFAAGAVVALLIGVFGKVHDPTLAGTTTLGFRTVIDMKVVLSVAIGVLAVLQLIGALWMYGKLGIQAPAWLGTAHRISGAIAVVLIVVVAYHCLWALGLESGTFADGQPVPARTVKHGVLGCAVLGALVVKVVAVRSRRAPGWFLPVAGGLLFALLIAAVMTSALWYVGAHGWPGSGGYG